MGHESLEHEHTNGFEHLDFPVSSLKRDFDLGEKFNQNTDGPVGWTGDPFLLYYVSFRTMKSEDPSAGTLHYALSRTLWNGQVVAEDDRELLRALTAARLQDDLAVVDRREDLPWALEETPFFHPSIR